MGAVLGIVSIVHEILVGQDRRLVVNVLLIDGRIDVVLVERIMLGVVIE
jgi:hypothetical protein